MILKRELSNPRDIDTFRTAWEATRRRFGPSFIFYLPGMIRYGRERGRYPAISITGEDCGLLCEHCRGRLLSPMIKITEPAVLIDKCLKLWEAGYHGILLSGGSDPRGQLPWERFIDAVRTVKEKTGLFISAHTGFPDAETAAKLKDAGIDQALIDIMGDDETAAKIYHLDGLKQVHDSLEGLFESGLQVIPHIVAGLFFGKMKSEYNALDIISRYKPTALVIVVLTPMKGTPMELVDPPTPIEIGRLVSKARLLMPETPISLGCERPRNRQGMEMEKLAILGGATRMAVWSEEAVAFAKDLGLTPKFQLTCCSLHVKK